jgi:exonuclease I
MMYHVLYIYLKPARDGDDDRFRDMREYGVGPFPTLEDAIDDCRARNTAFNYRARYFVAHRDEMPLYFPPENHD